MNLHMKMAVTVAALAGATMLLPAPRLWHADTARRSRRLAGVAALPGPLAPARDARRDMTTLTTKPDVAVAGTKFTISGKGLPANKSVTLTWGTSNVTWVVDARPDSVDYLGRRPTRSRSSSARRTTDA